MWRTVKLGEVCELAYGKALDKSERLDSDGVPAFGANGIKTYAKKSLFDEPSIIVGRKGSAGEITKVDEPFWALDVTYYIKIDRDIIDLNFLFYTLTTLNLPSMARGVKPGINRNDVYEKRILLPPIAEQQRIVAKLDAAFAGIDKGIKLIECKIEHATDAHAAYMEQVFRTSLLKYEQSTLGALCEFHNGKAHEKDISEDGEFCVVNSKFISSDGTIAKYTNKQMFPLITGDIVMVMSDVPNGRALAKAMQINEDGKYSLNQRICCIRSNHYHPQFLQTVLNRHPHFLKFNNGENQTNLRKNDILECPLPVIPLSGQISLLQSIQLLTEESHKLSKIYNAQSRNYDALKSAILAQELQSEAA